MWLDEMVAEAYAPKNTNSAAAITTEAQKAPMPAMTKLCLASRIVGGGTSGMRIFLLFVRSIMGDFLEHLRCHLGQEAERRKN